MYGIIKSKNVKTICLNVIKNYQRDYDTCGAASSVMLCDCPFRFRPRPWRGAVPQKAYDLNKKVPTDYQTAVGGDDFILLWNYSLTREAAAML
jgi:hypothetical protein